MAESFFAALKNEYVYRTVFPTRKKAIEGIAHWIEIIYNHKRLHSGLEYRTPTETHYGYQDETPQRRRSNQTLSGKREAHQSRHAPNFVRHAWPPPLPRLADSTAATKRSLASIAKRILDLNTEIAELDADLQALVTPLAPKLLSLQGIGLDVVGQLLVTVGDNVDRLRNEAAFAHLCGEAPIPRILGQDNTPPTQPGWRPRRKRGALPNRSMPASMGSRLGSSHTGVLSTTHRTRTNQTRNHPLPKALHRPRSVHGHPSGPHPKSLLTSIGVSVGTRPLSYTHRAKV